MPIFMSAVCTNVRTSPPTCKMMLPVSFEAEEETWGQVLSGLRDLGWRVEGGPAQRDVVVLCPACVKAESP